MNPGYYKSIASFLAVLVISLPFYVSSVYADMSAPQVHSNIVGFNYAPYIKDNSGRVDIVVNASIPGDNVIEPGQLELENGAADQTFSSCQGTGQSGKYRCTLDDFRLSDYYENGQVCQQSNGYTYYGFNVRLLNNFGALVQSVNGRAVCDIEGAKAQSISVSPATVNQDVSMVNLTFTVVDTANPSYSTGSCVGIKRVDIFSTHFATISEYPGTKRDECSYTSTVSIPTTNFPSEGTVTVNITAYDHFDQKGTGTIPQHISIPVDTGPPSVTLLNKTVTDENGNEVQWFTVGSYKMQLRVRFVDGNLDLSTLSFSMGSLQVTSYGTRSCTPMSSSGETVCTWSDVIFYQNQSSIATQVSINISDTLGNKAVYIYDLTAQFQEDTIPPTLNKMWILDLEGKNVTWVNSEGVTATVYLNLSDHETGVNPSRVMADLQSLNHFTPPLPDYGACTVSGTDAICSWPVTIKINSSGLHNLKFNYSDNYGNTRTHTIYSRINLDTTGPNVTGLYANVIDEEKDTLYVNSYSNEFLAVFYEDGIGLDPSEIFLDFSGINGAAAVAADSCEKNSYDTWFCRWNNVDLPDAIDGTTGSIKLSSSSHDKLGNVISTMQNKPVIYDSTPPVIEDIIQDPEYANTGEPLKFTLNISDTSGIFNGTVDVTDIVVTATSNGSTEPVHSRSLDCKDSICTITLSNLKKAIDVSISFTLQDYANNVLQYEYNMSVYEYDGQAIPNFITTELLTAVPPRLDRRTASVLSMKLWAILNVKPEPDTIVISKSVGCTSEYLAGSARLVNSDTENPLIQNALMSKNYDAVSKITFNCSLSYRVIHEDILYGIPETDSIDLSYSFYDNALGTLDSNARAKIRMIENELSNTRDEIDTWEQWQDILGKLCMIGRMIAMAEAILGALLFILFVVSYIAQMFGKGEGLWKKVCNPLRKTYAKLTKFWPVGIGDWTSMSWSTLAALFKWICLIYSCILCDLDYLEVGENLGLDSGPLTSFLVTGIGKKAGMIPGYVMAGSIVQAWMKGENEGGAPSKMDATIGHFKWEPWKSLHVSKACWCIPGMVYNYKKKEQILCMYKGCVESAAGIGAPMAPCDTAYKERECLYIDSAAWKIAGWGTGLMMTIQLAINTILSNIPYIWGSIMYTMKCAPIDKEFTGDNQCTGCCASGAGTIAPISPARQGSTITESSTTTTTVSGGSGLTGTGDIYPGQSASTSAVVGGQLNPTAIGTTSGGAAISSQMVTGGDMGITYAVYPTQDEEPIPMEQPKKGSGMLKITGNLGIIDGITGLFTGAKNFVTNIGQTAWGHVKGAYTNAKSWITGQNPASTSASATPEMMAAGREATASAQASTSGVSAGSETVATNTPPPGTRRFEVTGDSGTSGGTTTTTTETTETVEEPGRQDLQQQQNQQQGQQQAGGGGGQRECCPLGADMFADVWCPTWGAILTYTEVTLMEDKTDWDSLENFNPDHCAGGE